MDVVGRAHELAVIDAALLADDPGPPRGVHLVGEAGIGKTTIARHAARLARDDGWTVAWGRAWDAGGSPYQAWFQLLDVLVPDHPDAVGWPAGSASAGFGGIGPSGSPGPAPARAALHRRLLRAVHGACSGPLLVVLDDLHADPRSAELATELCAVAAPGRLVLVTTARPVRDGAPGADALRRLHRQGAFVPVGPLDRVAVGEQVTRLTGRPATVADLERILQITGGNPFLVEQVAPAAVGSGSSGPLPVTRPTRLLVEERLADLPTDARELVIVASLAGDVVETVVLAAATGWPPARLLDALEEAAAVGLLHPVGADGWAFPHALLRDATAAHMDPTDRRRRHHALAEAIDRQPRSPVRLAESAHHRRQAVPVGDPELMVRRTEEACRAAADVFAHDVAIEACRAALAALDAYGGVVETRPRRARLLGELGDLQVRAGELGAGRETLLDALGLARDAGRPDIAADVAVRIPKSTPFLVADRALQRELDAALAEVDPADLGRRARLLARHAVIAETVETRERDGDLAVGSAERLGDDVLLAEVLSARLFVTWTPEHAADRLAMAPRIIELGRSTGDLRRELDGRMWRFIALLEHGRLDEAEAELDRYAARADPTGQPEFRFVVRSRRAMLAAVRGRFEEAETLARQAHTDARDAGLADADAALGGQLALLALLTGRIDLRREARSLGDLPEPMGSIAAALDRAGGDRSQFRAQFPDGLPPMPADRIPGPARLLILGLLVDVAYRLGDRRTARAVYDALLPHAGRFIVGSGGVTYWGSVAGALGLCCAALGDTVAATDWWRRAIDLDTRSGAVVFAARYRVALADLRPTRPGSGEGCRVRLTRDRAGWQLDFEGRSVRLSPSKGLAQLAELLAHPGREITAVQLAGAVDPGGADPVLDDAAKAAYRRRLSHLDEQIERADARGDRAASARLAAERVDLIDHLRRSTGLAGRTRPFADDAERARVNVTRTVRQAIDRIAATDPEAGAYLATRVRTGHRCTYRPDGPYRPDDP